MSNGSKDREFSVSVVVPHVPGPEHDVRLKQAVDSLSGYDELVVVTNQAATIGFTKAVNIGLSLAKCDYLMVVNNDIVWEKGNLSDLCYPNAVTSPFVNGKGQEFWGCFFVIPRTVLEKVGLLDERFYLYCSDTDFVMRLREARIKCIAVETCGILTEGGRTCMTFPDRATLDANDTQKFIEKWGVHPHQVIS